MKLKIHRGTNVIGGSCVEVWTAETRIVIDFGLPLVNPDGSQFDTNLLKDKSTAELIASGILPDISGLYDDNCETKLIISHAHQDHYGLLSYINDSCHIYLGNATHKLINISGLFTRNKIEIANPHYFESGNKFIIGDISITPYLMDHSAFDAYAFLIEADGKSLFYSGDFRVHGRKAKAFYWFSHQIKNPVDYLLLEGTTIGSSTHSSTSEAEIEEKLIQVFKETKGINVIYTSGQNIDRLVSIFRACRRTGKILALDFYIATVLKELAPGTGLPYPSESFKEIRVFFPKALSDMIVKKGHADLLYQFKSYKITKAEITENQDNIVILIRPSMRNIINELLKLKRGNLIYSMWSGYLKEKKTNDFVKRFTDNGYYFKEIHTSGHADSEGLKKMVKALSPKNIVPIHTFGKNSYHTLFPTSKIVHVKDKDIIEI